MSRHRAPSLFCFCSVFLLMTWIKEREGEGFGEGVQLV